LQNRQAVLGHLNDRLHPQQRLQRTFSGDVPGLFSGPFGAGQVVLNALSSTGIVAVLIVYFVADLPRIRATLYRLVPISDGKWPMVCRWDHAGFHPSTLTYWRRSLAWGRLGTLWTRCWTTR
jgi:hypothetical protein